MTETVFRKVMEISGDGLKRYYRERREFESDRQDGIGRLKFMAHADGYVMVRRPRAVPFAMKERLWRKLPLFVAQTSADGDA